MIYSDTLIFINQIAVNLFLFILSFGALVLNRNNILISLLAFELMLLSANLNFLTFSYSFYDVYGKIFSIFILTVAASESAIGLALLIVFYRLFGTIEITNKTTLLKG